jgi:nicotinamide-nucleotide amidase
MKASIITIGDELLIGQILDTNSRSLGQKLTKLGFEVIVAIAISDKTQAITETLEQTLKNSDLVVVTGGLGPTKDDITKKVLAEYFKMDMNFDADLFQNISNYFKKIGIPISEYHRQQCIMPDGIITLQNKMGTAPGMLFENSGKWVVSMPGVPFEMEWIFENSLLPLLKNHYSEMNHIYFKTIKTVGIGETRIAEMIQDITEKIPKYISVAFLPSLGQVKVRLTSHSAKDVSHEVKAHIEAISEKLSSYVFGYDDITLEEALLRDFKAKNLSLSTVESCTGGYLAHRITSVSGSSEYYHGSLITYDNRLKKQLVNVSEDTLNQFGAVSEETVLEMLDGLLKSLKTDVGIATSGIAGPGGGSPEKPVGTIWMAWGNKEKKHTKKLQLGKDRIKNIEYTAVAAMNSLRLFLTEI